MHVVATLRARATRSTIATYVGSFDPIMSEQERVEYHDTTINKPRVAAFADRLLTADALVLVYPVWSEEFSAILKGFFDRVFIPEVSFKICADGAATLSLQNLKKARGDLHLWR